MEKLLFKAFFAENFCIWIARFEERFAYFLAVTAGNFEIFRLHTLAILFAAVFAACWFVAEALTGKKFLFAGRPGKIFTTLFTDKGFVLKLHLCFHCTHSHVLLQSTILQFLQSFRRMSHELIPGRSYVWVGRLAALPLGDDAIAPADRLEIDGSDLSVPAWRAVAPLVHQRPHGPIRLILLINADQISDIVQNMLLKVVEEPPSQAVIILQVKSLNPLLPTLRSRLQPLSGSDIMANTVNPSMDLNDEAMVQRILETAKDRDGVSKIAQDWLTQTTAELLSEPSVGIVRRSRSLEQALVRLQHNANYKLVCDDLILQMFPESGNESTRR